MTQPGTLTPTLTSPRRCHLLCVVTVLSLPVTSLCPTLVPFPLCVTCVVMCVAASSQQPSDDRRPFLPPSPSSVQIPNLGKLTAGIHITHRRPPEEPAIFHSSSSRCLRSLLRSAVRSASRPRRPLQPLTALAAQPRRCQLAALFSPGPPSHPVPLPQAHCR
ncbi:hypothetical protein PIB30_026302 [Stylosanthes scabra]|uniref:Uncharacterized protein n=1 Tax=Stylosanthes scabra TaxID=79078 RepID=A0ABU6VCM5_9FABA|nr:hypothetical protein [Stylosanthes scabra]